MDPRQRWLLGPELVGGISPGEGGMVYLGRFWRKDTSSEFYRTDDCDIVLVRPEEVEEELRVYSYFDDNRSRRLI